MRHVQDVEYGELDSPSIETVAAIAGALGVGIADLFQPPTSPPRRRRGRPRKRLH